MTWTAEKYARVLWELNMSEESLKQAVDTIDSVPLLQQMLADPTVYKECKEEIIDKVFSDDVKNVLKELCKDGQIGYLHEIENSYRMYANRKRQIVNGVLRYVTMPNEQQLHGIEEYIKSKFHSEGVDLQLVEDKSLLGGFVLEVEGKAYDWSLKGRFESLQNGIGRK